jgi:5-methyltetrahydropteroyltriglutamate--homocysteine methyltransferase
LLAAKARGVACDENALARETESATREVIARQVELGLAVVNNGEVGRESFLTYVQHRMTGFAGHSQRKAMADLLRYPDYLALLRRVRGTQDRVDLLSAPQALSEVRYVGRAAIDEECDTLKRLLAAHTGSYVDAFVSSPSPGIVATVMQNACYESLEAYVSAIGRALEVEYRAIVEHGFVLQIDAPDLALERHTWFQDQPLEEFLAFARLVVAEINRAIAGLPRERVRLHVCWGNYEGAHDLDVPLEDILPVLRQAKVGGYLLSMANPRHAHEHRLLEQAALPEDVVIVPGVIDTTTNYVEHPEVVADRIEQVVRAVGDPKRVIAGTDCGFESSAGTQAVVAEIAWAKLRALCEGARIASQRIGA